MSTEERIVSILSEEGPLLPVEIASKTGLNSFLIKGYLEELMDEGKIKADKSRLGSDFIFYLPGQEDKIDNKQKESQDSINRINNYKKRIAESPELRKKREEFLQRLKEIEEKEKKEQVTRNNVEETEESIRVEPDENVEPRFEDKKPVPFIHKFKEKLTNSGEPFFIKKAEKFLADKGIEIIKINDEKKKSKELVAVVPSRLYAVKHLVIIKDKKKISKSDLALAYTKSLRLRLPVLFITSGKLTKTGEEYLTEAGEFLKVKKLE